MLHGDISNRVEPRLMLVFEGLIGVHPDARSRAKYSMHTRLGNWRRAVRTFEINEGCAKVVVDAVWRRRYSLDVVTFLDEEIVDPLADWLDAKGLPVGNVTYADKTMLARELNYRLDVVGVFHPNPADVLVFGSKGYLVDPSAPVLFGA
jgi:hypothetical protein